MLVFVVGTGTDVGKTHVTAALVAAGGRAWKAVASGPSDDAARISAIAPPLYTFDQPVSPHLAARAAGVTITAAAITARARELDVEGTTLFIESAGGLFSPIAEQETNHDVALALGARVLLVAPDRIGVLHDVGAVVRASKIALPVVALSCATEPDASTGTNADEILRLGLARHVVVFPRGMPSASAARELSLHLKR